MPKELTLVIDQGTLATRALILDENGSVKTSAFQKIHLQRHGSELVEQDAEEIIESMQRVIRKVLNDSVVRRTGVAQAGLATQRSSVVAWDKRNGKPLGPLLSWQDRRAADWLKKFNPYAEKIKKHTGLPLSPHYGASKFRWCLEHMPAVCKAYRDNYLALGPLASFLLFHLLRGNPLLVDHANASRTQLWNIQTRDWDPWLLDLFGVPIKALPDCRPICQNYGFLQMADIPLTAVNGDQTSAIYSLGRPSLKTAIVNIGTGAFILLPTGKKLFHQPSLLSGLARSNEKWGEYIIEGTVNGAGAAINWAENELNLPGMIRSLSDWLSREGEIPLFINTIGGLGSPWWRPGPAPTILGDSEPWQKAVGVAESIVFLLQANLDTMLKTDLLISKLQVSGGLSHLDGICQRLTDLSQRPVYRPAETEATARGIAWLAAGCPLHWTKPGHGRLFKPQSNDALAERYKKLYHILMDS
jgi:glycerol kinase